MYKQILADASPAGGQDFLRAHSAPVMDIASVEDGSVEVLFQLHSPTEAVKGNRGVPSPARNQKLPLDRITVPSGRAVDLKDPLLSYFAEDWA